MSWVKLDDGFFRHPKMIRAGRDARDLYLAALCYCQAGLTDGFVDTGALQRLAADAEVEGAGRLAERLVDVGLWEPVPGGFRVHDYLKYNPSSAAVKHQRDENARRQDEWRERQEAKRNASRNGARNAVSNGRADASLTPAPSRSRPGPVPGPVPAGSRPGRTAAVAAGDGAAAPDSAAPPPELREFHALLSRLDGYEPTVTFFAKVTEKYLGLDLVEEAEKLRSWLADHPRERGSTRRVLNWLREAEDRAAERAARRNGQAVNGRAATVAAPNKYAAAVEAARV